jgi:hypothetical protein
VDLAVKKEGPQAPYASAKTKEKLPASSKTNQHLKLIPKREAASTRESSRNKEREERV